MNVHRHNLPPQATSFIGREGTIEAVKGLLSSEGTRLLTLTGTGGIGKTRVALEVAAELLEDFADGVCFVPFAPITDSSLFASAIAPPLNFHQSRPPTVFPPLFDPPRIKIAILSL